MIVLVVGLLAPACGQETALERSDCFDEYVLLGREASYSNALDAVINNIAGESSPSCGALVEALGGVKPEELGRLQVFVREADESNEYGPCLSRAIDTAGLRDDLTVTTPISSLDRGNAILRATSQELKFDAVNSELAPGVAAKFRVQEEGLLEGDRACRRRYLDLSDL